MVLGLYPANIHLIYIISKIFVTYKLKTAKIEGNCCLQSDSVECHGSFASVEVFN